MCGCCVEVCTTSWPRRVFHCASDAAPLDRAHGLAGGAQLARHRHGGLRLDRLEVHVGGGGEKQVVAPVLVHQRRAGLASGQHVGHRRQRLEVDLDLGGKVLGLGPRGRGAQRDQLADVAHLARGQDRLHGGLEARQRRVGADRRHALQIIGDEHAVADRRRDRDALDARVRDGAAQERHLQHAGQPDVADILPAPAHVAVVLLAQQPRPDALLRCHYARRSLAPLSEKHNVMPASCRRHAPAWRRAPTTPGRADAEGCVDPRPRGHDVNLPRARRPCRSPGSRPAASSRRSRPRAAPGRCAPAWRQARPRAAGPRPRPPRSRPPRRPPWRPA